jgi:SNF2 family DNA or RNA helicase
MKTLIGDKTLHVHQVTAVKWMMEREEDTNGGFLCDEMGLGKTLSLIGLLINKFVAKTLILGPVAVLRQWRRSLLDAGLATFELDNDKWCYKGGNLAKGHVYLTNYDKLTNDSYLMAGYDRLVLDEAHIMRNDEGVKYKRLKQVEARYKWFLTGTPIVNRLSDLGSLVRLLNKKTSVTAMNAPGLMNTLALYRTQEDLREHLKILPPPPKVTHHRIDFTTEEEAIFYRGIQGKLNERLEFLIEEGGRHGEILGLLTRLRQISTHPQVYIKAMRNQVPGYGRPDWTTDSSKVSKLVDIMRKDTGAHGYVIFCHFKDEMDVLYERLQKDSSVASIFKYHGGLSTNERADVLEECELAVKQNEVAGIPSLDLLDMYASHLPLLCEDVCKYVIDPFRGGSHTVLLAQIQSAGTGLNLQFMDRVVFTTPWWTAALMDQSVGRVLRLGQTKTVEVHHLSLSEEMEVSLNIDDYINERVEEKRELCERLLAAANHSLNI